MRSDPESIVQGRILKAYAGHSRIVLWRQNTGAARIGKRFVRFGLPGQADLQGVIAPFGRALFIECKSTIGKQSEAQVTFQRFVEKHGALYIVARELSDVTKVIGP
jgi:hypothetical protein